MVLVVVILVFGGRGVMSSLRQSGLNHESKSMNITRVMTSPMNLSYNELHILETGKGSSQSHSTLKHRKCFALICEQVNIRKSTVKPLHLSYLPPKSAHADDL